MQSVSFGKQLGVALFAVLSVVVFPLQIQAQTATQGAAQSVDVPIQRIGQASQYYLGATNELLIRVNIWGRVLRPGQYFIPSTTDLITLISVAGGPEQKSRLDNVRIVRNRDDGPNVIIVNIKKFIKTGDRRLIPNLEPEDTIILSGSTWQLVGDVVKVVSQLAIVANVYYWFFVAKTNK
ncbi:hypothetical protein KKG05_05230 [bacterium]|nr:hypothetical protein [bacterium]MBU1936782.1 hypothetical protein [bacterium]